MNGIVLPDELPIIPVKNAVIFPKLVLPYVVTDDTTQKLVDEVLRTHKTIGFLTQKEGEGEKAKPSDLYGIGCAAIITKMVRLETGEMRLIFTTVGRFKVLEFIKDDPYIVAKIEELKDQYEEDVEVEALKQNLLQAFSEVVKGSSFLPPDLAAVAATIQYPGDLADFVAFYVNFPVEVKQKILETTNIKERLKFVLREIMREVEVLKVSKEIEEKIKSEFDKSQREYILRQQLKAIQEELGILDEVQKTINEIKEKAGSKRLPEYAQKALEEELDRLQRVSRSSPEFGVIMDYINWILNLPWYEETQDNTDLNFAEKVLNEDHYDLKDVKERVLEFLAVRALKSDSKGPILCFVGPPGVGKTSVGKSIARALGRKFIRMSLGGLRDEAEIRGHRRTYIGALPGRIIQGMKVAGTINPVFMLDEVDKIGIDFRGDPASALLEVLDPEQNFAFVDNYLSIPYDLSKVLFIATANTVETIPPALLDRMEVIYLPGYILEDKIEIARKYLVPRQIRENGLENYPVRFSKNAIEFIVKNYTREAGVRNLERKISSVLRKVAVEVAKDPEKRRKIVVDIKKVRKYLGPEEYFEEVKASKGLIGVATGLAWTPYGGEILFIETLAMPGGGKLYITGRLGEVMEESCEAALSLVRSRADEFGIGHSYFEKHDIHIHVPEGATPKDGPSAGVAILVALTSLILKKPVDSEIAMTGEITLSGRILPVGGIKEKLLAARRAGIKKVILPEWNKRDIELIENRLLTGIELLYVSHVDEVFDICFGVKVSSENR
ncbi:MAG: endopeptidase La [candidate division WOR-3 bacterium]